MNVQELIDELGKVEDKSAEVRYSRGYALHDVRHVCELERDEYSDGNIVRIVG